MENQKTNHEKYLEKMMENSEFKEKFHIVREKVKIEMMLEALEEQVKEEQNKKIIIKEIRNISKYVSQIAVF